MSPAHPVRAVVPAALAVVAWLAVLLQLWLSVQLGLSKGKAIADGIVVFLGYFTVLTNIFVAFVASAGALSKSPTVPVWLYRPSVVGCATAAILLVGIAYHFLLRKIWSPQGTQLLADILLHYVVPAGALLHWLVYRDVGRLSGRAPLVWCLYPVLYLVYALARGELLGSYPYPFIDVTALGYQQVLVNAIGLMAGFVGLGYAVLGIARLAVAARVP
jgi:hypothetical protein